MDIYGKLINNKIYFAPSVLNANGKQYINPTKDIYLQNGYLPVEYVEEPEAKYGYDLESAWENTGEKILQVWNYKPNKNLDDLNNNQPKFKMLTKLEYDSIPLKDYNTLYFIIED